MASATSHMMDRKRSRDIRHAKKATILLTMCLGVFIAQLDSSVANLAVKPIGADLHASVSQLQWVIDSYNLVYATFLLTGGTLGDLYGRTRVFVAGIVLVGIGSLLCAAAPNAAMLVAGRAITGFGAALELPTTLSILAVTYTDATERGRALGIWAAATAWRSLSVRR
jgi:DHA2 family methylenomycin A resistance protein-like MFS transporter